MILIFGDSWGCGEWTAPGTVTNASLNVHRGLSQYLKESGQPVINLSQGGSSPSQAFKTIELFFESGCIEYLPFPITKVFVFQTEYIRDLKVNDFDVHYKEIIKDWYIRLSVVATKYSVQIGLIGGCSDTLDQSEVKFSNLYVACQSFTNLLVNNCSQIEQPVFLVRPTHLNSRTTYNTQSKHELIAVLERADERCQLFQDNPQWFWPDGMHPNRHGHKKLFDYLKNNGYLG